MLCHVDFESPNAFFFCARAWASPELSLGASSSEGWELPEVSHLRGLRYPASWSTFCVLCWELCLWPEPPCPACGHPLQCAKESRGREISGYPLGQHLPSLKTRVDGDWSQHFYWHSWRAEGFSWQRRSGFYSRGRSNIQPIHIHHTENSQKVLILDHLAKWSAQLQMSFSFRSLCWAKWENLFESCSWLILIAAVSSCCMGL